VYFETPQEAKAEAARTGRVRLGRVVRANRTGAGRIARTYGLHELAVEDAVHAYQRPKLECYSQTLFMVFKSVRHVAHD
jgi:Mg2+ and Co2+ transporter CorA